MKGMINMKIAKWVMQHPGRTLAVLGVLLFATFAMIPVILQVDEANRAKTRSARHHDVLLAEESFQQSNRDFMAAIGTKALAAIEEQSQAAGVSAEMDMRFGLDPALFAFQFVAFTREGVFSRLQADVPEVAWAQPQKPARANADGHLLSPWMITATNSLTVLYLDISKATNHYVGTKGAGGLYELVVSRAAVHVLEWPSCRYLGVAMFADTPAPPGRMLSGPERLTGMISRPHSEQYYPRLVTWLRDSAGWATNGGATWGADQVTVPRVMPSTGAP